MFAKSHARWFFLGGTGVFSATFLLLTVDTLGQVPKRSNEQNMTDQVIRGRMIWDKNNCMGCHTLLGEGAYYAPELTQAVQRRGEPWLRVFLRDPEAMFPGERKMVNYHFSDAEIEDVIAFLTWVGQINTNGFPPKPDLEVALQAAPEAAGRLASAPKVFTSICVACHAVDGRGGKVGPALDNIRGKYTEETLDQWLRDPQSIKPGTQMPKLDLPPETRAELRTWLLAPPAEVRK